MNKERISRLLQKEEIVEFTVIEMHNKEFLIHMEIPNKKNISMITNNWEKLIKEIY